MANLVLITGFMPLRYKVWKNSDYVRFTMKKLKTLIRLIKENPAQLAWIAFGKCSKWPVSQIMPDRLFLRIQYKLATGRMLNLQDPQRYTEKLQWLKLYERNPLHTKLVDKYEIRNFLKGKVDNSHFVTLYGVYERFDDIDWNILPESFIMKCTHGCGCNYIVKRKNDINKNEAKQKFRKWMRKNPYHPTKEWPYKNVKARIIVEELLENNGEDPVDFKFYCFDGVPHYCRVQYNIDGQRYQNYLDINFKEVGVVDAVFKPKEGLELKKPEYYDEMKQIATSLSNGMKHVRIDFLGTDSNFYMGEFTFFTTSGYSVFTPDSFDYEMGKLIKL